MYCSMTTFSLKILEAFIIIAVINIVILNGVAHEILITKKYSANRTFLLNEYSIFYFN